MNKLVIAGSAKFIEEMEEWKNFFKNKGYDVIGCPKKINQENSDEYKMAHISFFKSLVEADTLFVYNQDKNGIEGYIGAETFAELSFLVAQNNINNTNKKIYLLKMPSIEVSCYMEIQNFIELGWVEIFDKS